MNIAFINIYQHKVNRGAETYVSELAKRLSVNNTVKVYAGNKNPKIRWPVLWRFYLDPFGLQTFWETLKILPSIWKVKFDIVIPVNGGWQPALIRVATRLYGGKMVISGQSGIGWDDRNNLWCFPDVFISLSTKGMIWAKKVNPFVRSEYIPNGVDTNKFVNKKDSKYFKTHLKKPIILSVGAFTNTKRLELVIKAVKKIKDASLLIAGGGGELKDYIYKLGTGTLNERFQIVSLPYEKMPEIYRSADLFTLASLPIEAFGNVLVEAMATNLPVVATDDPIRKEIVGEAGILVDPTNTEAYATALKATLVKTWGQKPRNQSEKFDWDKIAQKYEELFQKLTK